jgi:hypothetical protein
MLLNSFDKVSPCPVRAPIDRFGTGPPSLLGFRVPLTALPARLADFSFRCPVRHAASTGLVARYPGDLFLA